MKIPEEQHDPYVRSHINEFCPAQEHTHYTINRVNQTKAQRPRHMVAEYVVKLATKKPPVAMASIYNRTAGIVRYLNWAAVEDVSQLDAATFRRHFSAEAGTLSPQVWYERQRAVLDFMQGIFGPDEGAKRCPAAKPKVSWASNRPNWYEWQEERKVWLNLDMRERARFALIAGSLTPVEELLKLPMSAISFEPDGICLLELQGKRGQRWGGVFFGERSVLALHKLAQEPHSGITWVFPDPANPTRPMTRRQFTHMVYSWGERAGIKKLNPRRLQTTLLAYLLGQNAASQAIAHLMGVRQTKRIDRVRDHVKLAQNQGHLAGRPNFAQDAPGPGLLSCDACGRINPVEANFCSGCGLAIRGDAGNEESLLKAQMHDRLKRLLDLFGESPSKRVQDALDGQGASA